MVQIFLVGREERESIAYDVRTLSKDFLPLDKDWTYVPAG